MCYAPEIQYDSQPSLLPLASMQAAELQLVAEDKQYHASTLAVEVVVYGTGKKFAAVVPAIRRNSKDSDGNWVLLEPKTDRTARHIRILTL